MSKVGTIMKELLDDAGLRDIIRGYCSEWPNTDGLYGETLEAMRAILRKHFESEYERQ